MAEKKLLVADDSLTIQKVIRLALSNEGYEIQTVSDGHDAVQQISLFRPNIVLIDISLPGKSAFEVKREINNFQDFEEIRFVLMSSAFEKVDEVQMKEVGFHGNLTKPFDPSHLRQILLDALSQITKKRAEKTTILSKTGLSHSALTPAPTPALPSNPTKESTSSGSGSRSFTAGAARAPASPPPLASGVRDIEPREPTSGPGTRMPDTHMEAEDTEEEAGEQGLETDLWDVGQDPATLSSLPSIPQSEPEEPETTFAAPTPKKPSAPAMATQASRPPAPSASVPPQRLPQGVPPTNKPAGTSSLAGGTSSISAAAPPTRPTQSPPAGQPPTPEYSASQLRSAPESTSTANNRTSTLPLTSSSISNSAQANSPAKIKYPQREATERSTPTASPKSSAPSPTSMPEPMARPFSQQPWQTSPQFEGTMDLPEIKTEEKEIQELTSSTFLMNNASDFQWNVNEPTLRPMGQIVNAKDAHFELESTEPFSQVGRTDLPEEPTLAAPVIESTESDPTPVFDPPTSPDFGLSDPNLVNPLDPSSTPTTPGTPSHAAAFSQTQLELLVRQEVQNLVEKTVRLLIPEIAEKLIKEEIHRILSDS